MFGLLWSSWREVGTISLLYVNMSQKSKSKITCVIFNFEQTAANALQWIKWWIFRFKFSLSWHFSMHHLFAKDFSLTAAFRLAFQNTKQKSLWTWILVKYGQMDWLLCFCFWKCIYLSFLYVWFMFIDDIK